MLKDKLVENLVAGIFIFDILIIFVWSMLFFWHVMLGLAILGVGTIMLFFIIKITRAATYLDEHLLHQN